MRLSADSSASLRGALANMARGIGTTLGIALLALALRLGSPAGEGHGYAGATQARPAFIVLAAVSAAAAAISLASRGQRRGPPGQHRRRTRQVPSREGDLAQEQVHAREVLGQEQIGPELADIVSRLRRAIRRAGRAADPALGLSVAQLELLSCMADDPGVRPSQLARMLRLAPSSVATLLSGLQSSGYVRRTPGGHDAGDRRTVSLDLSDEGLAAVTRWHRVNEEIVRAALTALPERDQAALRDAAPALRDLTAAIDALAD